MTMTSGGRRLAIERRAGGAGRGGTRHGARVQGSRPAARRDLGEVSISMILKFEIIFRLHNKIAFILEFGVNVTIGMRASGLQDPVALVSIGGWSPNQGTPQLAIILNPSLRRRCGLCPGWPYWAAAMGLSDLTLSTELEPMGLSSTEQGKLGTLTGSRQVEPRGKSMGTAIDGEPTAIDLFNELHCSKTKGFSEPVKKAIEDMHAREALTSSSGPPSTNDGIWTGNEVAELGI
uniref:Uncharacterized protein n=1 Tax=Oryza rufipogon TaxID=4529 RepID=A0A0E0MW74_ORYRU